MPQQNLSFHALADAQLKSQAQAQSPPTAALRSPDVVMKAARMGSFHQTRLSFMRALMRALKKDKWRCARAEGQIDKNGVGHALYRAIGPTRSYTLLCFSHDLPPEKRSDRVIADQWDATFALYDGVPNDDDIARLAVNVPKQEAGGCRQSELVLARANRSVRLFDYVVETLARGGQPAAEIIDRSGYLMRTTAVYGNGKFGLSDRERIADRVEFAPPFRAELLTVWLIRWFTIDIAEHLAHTTAPQTAVPLARDLARRLGVGNATGLGMAPFLLTHPALLHCWMTARETALARVRALPTATKSKRRQFAQLLIRMRREIDNWRTADRRQTARICELTTDLAAIDAEVAADALDKNMAWDKLIAWSEKNLSLEGRELLVTLIIEPHGELVDDLVESMAIDESLNFRIDGEATIGELLRDIARDYQWALQTDYHAPQHCARFWYVSEEKLEPRLGERFIDAGAEVELPLTFARDIAALHLELTTLVETNAANAAMSVGEFLRTRPHHRHAVRRGQIVAQMPFAEIRDNLIAADLLPIDLLRCKLSFFGAGRFDPKSDRWVRITMYQHAPFPDELADFAADDWSYPPADA